MEKSFLSTVAAFAAGSAFLFTLTVGDAAAAGKGNGGRGQGQGLRDGSCLTNSAQNTQKTGRSTMKSGQRGTGLQDGTGAGYGDGTRPRPQDGTGFGSPRR